MNKNFIYTLNLIILSFLFTGCVTHYKNVKSKQHASLQLISKSISDDSDYYYADISDYSKGCQDMVSWGYLVADTQTSSKTVKVPVDKALHINVRYTMKPHGNITFILRPQKNKHYIVEYIEKEKTYHVYSKEGNKIYDVPKSRLRMFHVRECL
ncbi:MAG: hypothetical protein COA44_04025 [Arcobacter sp.]|nr:MAG: hypothetical protein COA44_04025 [Arcobacter sp.]